MTVNGGSVVELLGVYNADGGLLGEMRYVVGHLLGRVECQLCDITHSPVRRKREWDLLVSRFPLPLRVVHRNEIPAGVDLDVRSARLPAVYAVDEAGRARDVLGPDDLAGVDGSVEAFEQLLLERLSIGRPGSS
jgi:hypothetical protein